MSVAFVMQSTPPTTVRLKTPGYLVCQTQRFNPSPTSKLTGKLAYEPQFFLFRPSYLMVTIKAGKTSKLEERF